MKRPARLSLLGPLAFMALSVACSQVLDIQDARIDPSLTAGSSATNGGTSSMSDGGERNSAGTGAGGSGHVHGGGSANQAGTSNTAGTNSGGDTSSAGAGGSDDQPQSTCDAYCDSVLKNCTGKYEQYRTRGQCMEVCKRLPAGSPGDENVNSVECRIRQARFAEAEAFLYCKSAGPLGAGKCGTNCESYCSLMDATCTQASTAGNVELSYFDSHLQCMSNCGAMVDDPSGPNQYSSSATLEPNSLVGNNIYCRTYHVAAGIEQDAASEHCPHAMGGDPCVAQ